MMKTSVVLLGLLAASSTTSASVELTPDNYDHLTAGHTVFIKFYAPWCEHSKKLAPDWDKLEADMKSTKTVLIGEVDCDGEGKPICDANGVKGFPTLKYGNPAHLEEYSGNRDLSSLKSFAKSNLKPQCSPTNLSLCSKSEKAEIKKYSDLSDKKIDAKIKEMENEMAAAEEDFKSAKDKMQKDYQSAFKKKEADVQAVKDGVLGLLQSVKIAKNS